MTNPQGWSSIDTELVRDATERIVGAYWTLCCGWCRGTERIDMTKHTPVTDPRAGISSLKGWEIGNALIVCPDCVEHDEWSRM